LKVKREKATSTKGHYVTNAQLLPAVLEAKQLGRVTDRLARMLLLIAERYSRKSWFSGYSYREDMVALAMANLCQNALKFDPAKSSNPFAYYTTAIHNCFQQYKHDERKHRNIRDSLLVDAGANPSFNFLEKEKEERLLEAIESDDLPLPENLEKEHAEPEDEEQILPENISPAAYVPKVVAKRRVPASMLPGKVTIYKKSQVEIVDGQVVVKEKKPRVPKEVAKKAKTAVKKTKKLLKTKKAKK
jgi:DNA-directed RNA polymerase specialized sigma24 family protein